MHLNEYQEIAMTTWQVPAGVVSVDVIYPVLGLAGEAGEVVEKFKKFIRNQDNLQMTDEFKLSVRHELGDVLWYIAAIANTLGYTLEEVANENVIKLKDRYERGVIRSEGDHR